MHALLTLPSLNQLAELSRLSSTALISAIWQGALLALIAALVVRIVPRIAAAARFAIWFAVFTLIAALPMLQLVPRNLSSPSSTAPTPTFFSLGSRWTLVIAALWAAASLLRAVTLITAALRVRTLSRNARPIEVSQIHTASGPRCAQLCASTDIDRPTIIGFFSPKILIPAWLLEKLTPAELDHIVLHESSHLNRADDWLNLLQKLALVLFPLNPALAWVERRLCFERELACDERVLAELRVRAEESERSATSYASSLATLAEYRLQRRGVIQTAAENFTLALGALGRESELGRRVARILRPAARMKPLHVRLATGAAIAVLLFTTAELERSPQLVSFTSPAPAAQLAATDASPTTPRANILSGYRAFAVRSTLPTAQQIKQQGDATPHLISVHSQRASEPDQPHAMDARAVEVRATIPTQSSPLHRAAERFAEPQANLVVTRYTVTEYQSAEGYRIVRTSAVISEAPSAAVRDSENQDFDSGFNSSEHNVKSAPPAPRVRQISQPYAAVPVPGGWLVFQL